MINTKEQEFTSRELSHTLASLANAFDYSSCIDLTGRNVVIELYCWTTIKAKTPELDVIKSLLKLFPFEYKESCGGLYITFDYALSPNVTLRITADREAITNIVTTTQEVKHRELKQELKDLVAPIKS